MKTAMRVLSAISERLPPNPQDVAELRSLAPAVAQAPLDELACEVIQQAVKLRLKEASKKALEFIETHRIE